MNPPFSLVGGEAAENPDAAEERARGADLDMPLINIIQLSHDEFERVTLKGNPTCPNSTYSRTGEENQAGESGYHTKLATKRPSIPRACTEQQSRSQIRNGNDDSAKNRIRDSLESAQISAKATTTWERETTPGFQRDKTERGTIMPH